MIDWDRVQPLLEEALRRSPADNPGVNVVMTDIEIGESQLWDAGDTVVVTTPDGPDLLVWLYAGRLEPMAGLFRSARQWAYTLGFERLRVREARKGWARVLRPLGFTPDGDGLSVKIGD